MTRVSIAELRRLRLASHLLSQSPFARVEDVVRHMTALQAQDFNAAKWAIGLRSPGATNASIEAAIASRKIVRSWPMRGTLHFLAAEDLSWILQLTSARSMSKAKTIHASRGLGEKIVSRARDATLRALEGGKCLTREEMHDVFRGAKIDPENERGYMLLWILSHEGLLCFGPPRGTSQTFVLASEWIERSRVLGRDEALGELALRYFRSHGPATLQDFSFWSGLTIADSKVGLAIARASLDEVAIAETPYFIDPKLLSKKPDANDSLYALPSFDEFLLGYRDRRPVVTAAEWTKIIPGKNGVFSPVLVRDGAVVGTWRRVIEKKTIVATASPFDSFGKKDRAAFAKTMRAYGIFFEMPVTIGE